MMRRSVAFATAYADYLYPVLATSVVVMTFLLAGMLYTLFVHPVDAEPFGRLAYIVMVVAGIVSFCRMARSLRALNPVSVSFQLVTPLNSYEGQALARIFQPPAVDHREPTLPVVRC